MTNNNQIILTFFLIGASFFAVICVNIWHIAKRRAKADTIPSMTKSVRIAWGTSLVSLLIPYLAPISLMFALYGYVTAKKQQTLANNMQGLVFAIINSVWAIAFIVLFFTFVLALLVKQT